MADRPIEAGGLTGEPVEQQATGYDGDAPPDLAADARTPPTDASDRVVEAGDGGAEGTDGPVVELDVDRPDEIAPRSATVRQLAVDEQVWRFGHVIVDEAQDLTPMQWRMVVRRSRPGAVTVLGDLAQRSVGEPGRWRDHLPPVLADFDQRSLTTNYRSPAEINELTASVLAALAPELPASRSVRRVGFEPELVRVDSIEAGLGPLVADMIGRAGGDGLVPSVAVIGFDLPEMAPARALDPWRAKGLEFDAVVVVEPARFLDEPNGLSLLYVALTRSTRWLTIVHHRPLPKVLCAS